MLLYQTFMKSVQSYWLSGVLDNGKSRCPARLFRVVLEWVKSQSTGIQ